MLIQTNGEARAAMQVLNADILASATDVATSYASSNLLTQAAGGNMVEESAANLLNQLAASWITAFDTLDGADDDPLTDAQIARLRELQNEVIADRRLVGQAISSVDWTFGDFASDVGTQMVNAATQTVAAIKDALPAVPWTAIEIGLMGVGLVVVFAIYRRVSGR
jgi:hypothetical protein